MAAKPIKTDSIQTSFASGELSPWLRGRVDRDVYKAGADKLRNVIVTPLGGVLRRYGTKYLTTTNSNNKGRLVAFEFNATTTYELIFTAGRLDIYKQGVYQTTLTSSPISTLTLPIIESMNWAQSLNTMIIVHPDLPPIQLVRSSDTSWAASNITILNIPLYAFNGITETQPAHNLTPSGVTGIINLTVSASHWTAGDVGKYVVLDKGGKALITSYVSGTVVKAQVVIELLNTDVNNSGTWYVESGYEAVWSGSRGYPTSVAFLGQRLFFGGSKSRPNTVWGSLINSYYDFDTASGLDADGIDYTIGSDNVAPIVNIFAGRTLQVFTEDAEYFIPIDFDSAVTPSKFKLEAATRYGSSKCRNVSSDGSTLFVEKSGGLVREYLYLDVERSYVAGDISYISEHLIRQPVAMAIQKSTSVIAGEFTYLCNGDGTIAVLNRRRAQEFLAWTLWETDGFYESICVSGGVLYMLVRRVINGNTVRYFEQYNADYYTDAGRVFTSGSPTTAITGNTHLNGKAVNVRSGDGYALLPNVVASGNTTVEVAQTSVEIGLPFTPLIRTMPPAADGAITGVKRRIATANFQLDNTNNFSVTTGQIEYDVVLSTIGLITFGQPSPKYTGWKKIHLNGFSREPYLEVKQSLPLDLHILSMVLEVTT